jgi:hypothetical protein
MFSEGNKIIRGQFKSANELARTELNRFHICNLGMLYVAEANAISNCNEKYAPLAR